MSHTKIAIIIAHPDDEAFCASVTLHEATLRGHEVLCLLATPGNAGKTGRLGPMSPEELADVRKKEMAKAAEAIGISLVEHLDYYDGKLQEVNREQLMNDVVRFIEKHQVQVVMTFPEDGLSGHKDHKAIHYAVRDAVISQRCESVRKLYYFASRPQAEAGREPSVRIDSSLHWEIKRKALLAHESQILSIERVFGDMSGPSASRLPYESFVLAWEDGEAYPRKKEIFLTDGIVELG